MENQPQQAPTQAPQRPPTANPEQVIGAIAQSLKPLYDAYTKIGPLTKRRIEAEREENEAIKAYQEQYDSLLENGFLTKDGLEKLGLPKIAQPRGRKKK